MGKYLNIARQAQRRQSEPPGPPRQVPAPPPKPSQPATATPQSYTPAERQLVAGLPANVRGTLDDAKAVFGSDAEVVSVEPEAVADPRRAVAQMLREARKHDSEHAIAMRDSWHERMAICTVDGHQSETQAEHIALAEIAGTESPADPWTMTKQQLERWISTTHEGTRRHEEQCELLPV